jgi:branched-chain amino acid transport system permease protein
MMKLFKPMVLLGYLVPLVLLALLPMAGVPRSWTLYAFLFAIYIALTNSWNLLAGYSGLVSLCQPAFFGIAGYAMIIGTWLNVPWWIGLLGGAAIAALFALLLSNAVFRLTGVYFSIGTLVVPEALRMVFYLWRPVGGALQGGGSGYMIKGAGSFLPPSTIYWMALAVGLCSIVVMRIVLRSDLGLGLAAVRDNEKAAAACGVNVFRLKVYTFMISAAMTGLAGGVYYLNMGYIEPSSTFNVKWTMVILLATVIGGIRTEEGPLIGSVVAVALYFMLARYSGYSLLIQGIILILIMLLSPQGIVGMLRKMRWYRNFTAFTER